jgi:hypothetical protein
LFLQTPEHIFRPKFTVLSHPGAGYVGGDDFFDDNSALVCEFDINDIASLAAGNQPRPSFEILEFPRFRRHKVKQLCLTVHTLLDYDSQAKNELVADYNHTQSIQKCFA